MTVKSITDDNIAQAVVMPDLHGALFYLQSIAGITDGGLAGMFFDADFDWLAATIAERDGAIRDWLDSEANYEESPT